MDAGTERLIAVGWLIDRIRRAGIDAPIEGPEFRSLVEIAAGPGRIVVLGPGGRFRIGRGRADDVDVMDDVDDVDLKSHI